ncbi:hypothetical protein INT47_000160 [Mucor saturninus]|uniref:Uncharacterized protein n=1 Tax=Mucor saturninus TaxID=64648 RepID=A0A8H7RIB0_9FUNG|nr:hypothetical protein INT47_000160 [Mucor saturninus]
MARTGRPSGKKNPVGHSAGRPSIQKKDDPRQTTLFQTIKKINQNGESSSQADEAVVEESSMQEKEIDISVNREEQLPVVEDQNIFITLDEEEQLNNRILPEIDDDNDDGSVADEQEFLSGEVQNGVLYHYFEEVQKRLTEEAMPAEYNDGTFWIRPMQPFFCIIKEEASRVFVSPRYFFMDSTSVIE